MTETRTEDSCIYWFIATAKAGSGQRSKELIMGLPQAVGARDLGFPLLLSKAS